VSRVADADETFSDISDYVSQMIITKKSSALQQMLAAGNKLDIEVPVYTRRPELPACPFISVYGISVYLSLVYCTVLVVIGMNRNAVPK